MNNIPVTVVAQFQARPGKEAELKAALIGLVAPTRKEKGCLNYDLHLSPTEPDKFIFYENWSAQKDLDAHMQSPHLQALLPRVNDLCAAFPQVTIWQKLA